MKTSIARIGLGCLLVGISMHSAAQTIDLEEIRTVLNANAPGKGDLALREAAIVNLDAYLKRPDMNTNHDLWQFYNMQIAGLAEEIARPVPAGARIWKMYNHGYIVKTADSTLAFDLVDLPRNVWPNASRLSDALLRQIDVVFISHSHRDHYDRVSSRIQMLGGAVVGPPQSFPAGTQAIVRGLNVTAYFGAHSVPNNIFHVTTPEGLTIMHTGDTQRSYDLPSYISTEILLINAWMNESGSQSATEGVRRGIKRISPLLTIPGHIHELNHAYNPGSSASRVPYEWALAVDDVSLPGEYSVMAWGELYEYNVPDTHYVDVNNSSPIPPYLTWASAANNIQTAVNAASDGDTVLIADGTYHITTQIYIGKNLTIQSVNGPESVTVDAGGHCRVFFLNSYNGAITLDGLTVTGGYGDRGGGIFSKGYNPIEMIDCIIEGNAASLYGGGMYGGIAENCLITNNHSGWDGGGISRGRAINCIIENNTASWSGGGMLGGMATNCTIEGNTASRNGGGISDGTAENCVISNNSASGGGGLADSTAYNCVIEYNTAKVVGGGMDGGTARNCVISGNSALIVGGGIAGSTIYNCTVTRNTARVIGGMNWGTAYNSIVWHNVGAVAYQDMERVTAFNCSSPDLEHGISGNITNMPLLVSASHISSDSPCLAAGDPMFAGGTDIDGQPWLTPPSMGCDEFHGAGSVTGTVAVAIGGGGNVTEDYPSDLFADIDGQLYSHVWDFDDGTTETNRLVPEHVWEVPGIYDVKLTAYSDSYPGGISATQAIHVVSLDEATLYVDGTTGNDLNSGLDWANAKRSITAAVQSHPYFSGRVLVTDGVYNLAEGIVVDKSLWIESVNGPAETIIDGNGADLCVYLGPGCRLRGFSVRNGIGGIWGFASSIVDSCWVYENAGTGIWGGNVYDSVIRNNMNYGEIGGGLDDANAYNCLVVSNLARIGGGIDMSGGNDGEFEGKYEAVNCVVRDNTAQQGGGILGGEARNCVVSGNVAYNGGGIHTTTALNCTVVDNTAEVVSGAYRSSLYNSIVCSNVSSGAYTEIFAHRTDNCVVSHSCSPGLTNGVDGNINTDPLFIDPASGNYRLLATSPCIDAGSNAWVTTATDLDGNARIVDGDFDDMPTVDMGAYEFSAIMIPDDCILTSTINTKSKGRTPVAILSTDEFDATLLDPASVRCAGAACVRQTVEDLDGDGNMDLKLHFLTSDLIIDGATGRMILIGQTFDGTYVAGVCEVKMM